MKLAREKVELTAERKGETNRMHNGFSWVSKNVFKIKSLPKYSSIQN